MISLFIACLLFVSKLNQEPGRVEYKVITTMEYFFGNTNGRSRIILQNGKLKEELPKIEDPGHYIFNKPSQNLENIKADSVEFKNIASLWSRNTSVYDNVAKNDAIITEILNDLSNKGWALTFVTSQISDSTAGVIFTKYYFQKEF